MEKRKYIILILILIPVSIWSLFWYYSIPSTREHYAHRIPLKIGSWIGEEMPVDSEVLEILETDDAVFRKYNSKGQNVLLWLVFAGENRKSIHPMEVCYRASGWDIGSKEEKSITVKYNNKEIELPCIKLTAVQANKSSMVVYWYKSGNRFTDNYYLQQLNVSLQQLLNRNSTSTLIGVWGEPGRTDDQMYNQIVEFIKELFPYIMKYIP